MAASSQAPQAKGFSWKLIAPLVVWLAIYLWPVPTGLNANQWHYFAVFAAVITGLILESMPVGAVGFIGLTVAGVAGYIDPDPGKSLRWMLAGFAESTVWLIVGAFVFSIGYRKSQLGRRIALVLVQKLGRNTLGLGYAVAMSDFLLAPATPSNTARSGGIVYPIISNIPRIYGSEPGPTAGKIGTYVMWTAFAATAITQLAVLHRARAQCGRAGDRQEDRRRRGELGAVVRRLCAARHPPDDPRAAAQLCGLPSRGEAQPGDLRMGGEGGREMGPMSRNEWIMLALIILAMFLWIAGSSPDIHVPLLGSNFVNATTVVFIVISLMLVTGVIEFADIVSEKSAWEVFFYFTSLLTLASGLNEIGFIKWFANEFAKPLAGLSPSTAMILLVALFFWIHYFFSSITSHAAAVLPVVLAVGIRHPRPAGHDARHALHVFARPDGRDLALRDGTRADVFRQRLYREGPVLGLWAAVRAALFRGTAADRAALVADQLSAAGG